MDAARRSKKNSPVSDTPVATRKPSTRVKNVVDYDEKRAFIGLSDDTIPRDPPPKSSNRIELEERVNDLSDSWETSSIFEEIIEELADDKLSSTEHPDTCTAEEAVKFRQILRTDGPQVLIKRYVQSGLITAKKLLTAFGIRPPAFLDGAEDHAYYSLLSLALSRELNKRVKLPQYNTIDDAVALLRKSKNIMVLTGAGISTSLGIPDFRSKGIGLYSKLEHLGLNDPQEVFDISVFRQDPTIFYSVARDILPSTERFSPTHAFIALLQEKGKLLTNYSQNIDNLEAKAGIRPDKLVQCHGSFATASCVKCGFKVVGDTLFAEIKAGKIPKCTKCASASAAPAGRKRKLNKDGSERKPRRRPGDFDSNSDSEFDVPSNGGVMKPDITFFGEPLPDEFSTRLTEHDKDLVDLVIVIGTSLKVSPVSEVAGYLRPEVPQIYISRTPITHINFDIDLLGDCDVVVAELCRRAGWGLEHEMVPQGQKVEVELEKGYPSRWVFKEVWPAKKEEEDDQEKEKVMDDLTNGKDGNGIGNGNGAVKVVGEKKKNGNGSDGEKKKKKINGTDENKKPKGGA